MKHQTTLAYLASLLVLFSSCSNRERTRIEPSEVVAVQSTIPLFPALEPGNMNCTEENFGEVIELRGTPVQTDALFSPNELGMMVKNDLLILKTNVANGMIKILSIPDLMLVREIGVQGGGPDELQNPYLIATNNIGLICYLYDSRQEKIFQIDTAFTLSETGFPLQKQKNQIFGTKQLVEYGARRFYYASNSITGKGIFHYQPDLPDSTKLLFDLEEEFTDNLVWSALIGDFAGNQTLNRLVYAYKYFHKIRFFNPQTRQFRTLNFKSEANAAAESQDPRAVLAPTSVTHYWGISSQPDHVYCLYSGRTPIQVTKEFQSETDHIFIEQFDWNGNPIHKYRLDHWGYFCVDESRRTIYLAAVSAEEAIYSYTF